MANDVIAIGSRGSALALAQANAVCERCRELLPSRSFVITTIVTQGDRKQGTAAAAFGDKKDWILEIETALKNGAVDFAVHSAKDVPLNIDDATALVPVLTRADAADVLVLAEAPALGGADGALTCIGHGGTVGTSSLRRRSQLLRARPDLTVEPVRGNVPTRIAALKNNSELAAVVLAGAGLARLGDPAEHVVRIPPTVMLPAVHQGILVAQHLGERGDVRELLARLSNPEVVTVWEAERSCLAVLNADCSSAVAIFGHHPSPGTLRLQARVLSPDGAECLDSESDAPNDDALELGRSVGARLLSLGAARLLRR